MSYANGLGQWAGAMPGRGPIEMNFVVAGGDVRRFDAVALDDDERMVKVPVFNGGTNTLTQWSHLPPRP